MSTGDSADILGRVKRLIPNRWFAWVAPNRDAILGGLSDLAAWIYAFIGYARLQSRIATATGPWLDVISYDYLGRYLPRNGMTDQAFRTRILATILQERVTRAGMVTAITALTGTAPQIFEPWNTNDTGAYGVPTMGYGVGKGGWGNMNLPAQTFMMVKRAPLFIAPNVAGYGSPNSGYGVGTIEYIGSSSEEAEVEDSIIYATIEATKASGTTCWVHIH